MIIEPMDGFHVIGVWCVVLLIMAFCRLVPDRQQMRIGQSFAVWICLLASVVAIAEIALFCIARLE